MLPIRETALHLAEIAEYWSRELGGVRTPIEIHAELLSAFWQGRLDGVRVHDLHPINRESALKGINSTRDLISQHPGFTLVDSAEIIPQRVEQYPDGSVTIDQKFDIVLPSNYADWTDEIVSAVCNQFAKIPLDDFHEFLKPPIAGLGAAKEAFAAYCDLLGWDRPRFWFAKERPRTWTARRQREAEAWLKQIASGPKRKPKGAYFVEAVQRFPGLSHTIFELIWKRLVPPSWKRSGPVVRQPRGRKRP